MSDHYHFVLDSSDTAPHSPVALKLVRKTPTKARRGVPDPTRPGRTSACEGLFH